MYCLCVAGPVTKCQVIRGVHHKKVAVCIGSTALKIWTDDNSSSASHAFNMYLNVILFSV